MGQLDPSPAPSTFGLSFFLTIFTPLSPALLLRDEVVHSIEPATASGCCDGEGGLATRGNGCLIFGIGVGTASTDADVGCGRVPGLAGSDGCAGAGGSVPVAGACASCNNFASICAILSSVLYSHHPREGKKSVASSQHKTDIRTRAFLTSSVSSEHSLAN